VIRACASLTVAIWPSSIDPFYANANRERVSHGGGGSWPDEIAVGNKGIAPSIAVAEGRFRDLAEEYWRLWSGAGYEVFAAWLDVLKRTVGDEVAWIWKGHSDVIDQWYESACRPAVEKALTNLVGQWDRRAREAELERLKRGEWLEQATAANWKSPKLAVQESALSRKEPAHPRTEAQAPTLPEASDRTTLPVVAATNREPVSGGSVVEPISTPVAPDSKDAAYLFRRQGDLWELVFAGQRKTVRHSIGLLYIADLLRSPRTGIEALALASRSVEPEVKQVISGGMEVADQKTIRQVQRALGEKQAELASLKR
jgi:hypothetical protein